MIPLIVQLSLDLQEGNESLNEIADSLRSENKTTVQGANVAIYPYIN